MSDAKQATPMEAMQAALDHAKWLLKNASVCELSAHNEAVRNWALEWDQRAINAEAALAAANEAREKAERERDEARENARVRSGEALDYYSAMLNFAHEFGAKDGDNMIEVIGNGIDALRAEVERLREDAERIRIAFFEFYHDWKKGDFQLPELAACDVRSVVATYAAIDAARKES